jgi:methionyl-tRNA synthetase
MLASAGLPLPTDIIVHDYLTVEGRKISKSSGASDDPAGLAGEYGTDAIRWWLLRDVPRIGDADFTRERLVRRANDELAHGIGNLVNRVVAMIGKYRDGLVPPDREQAPVSVGRAGQAAPAIVDAALAVGDFRQATAAVWAIAQEANRYISQARPWLLARAERDGDQEAGRQLDAVLAALVGTCRKLADELAPFLPDAAARIARQTAAVDGLLPPAQPLFARQD